MACAIAYELIFIPALVLLSNNILPHRAHTPLLYAQLWQYVPPWSDTVVEQILHLDEPRPPELPPYGVYRFLFERSLFDGPTEADGGAVDGPAAVFLPLALSEPPASRLR